jgi:hypothetical protein
MSELRLGDLPDLPQRETLLEVAAHLWAAEEVVALWVGGSLASGAGDRLSDVDFRAAVEPERFAAWKAPRFEQIFTRSDVVGQTSFSFGDDACLHHLVLSNGEIFDFFVQSTIRRPTQEPLIVLGCRSDEFAQMLAEQNSVPPLKRQAVKREVVRDLLVSFWINSHKHRKVLYRGLDLLATLGLRIEQSLLLRLWYIEASGQDCGDVRDGTIHSLTEIVLTLDHALGPQALALVGTPMGNRQEIYQAIEHNRQSVSHLGRRLAQSYDFDYPAVLEATVLQGWQAFLAERKHDNV